MLIRNPIHFGAYARFLRRKAKKISDLIKGEAQIPTTADETKAPAVFQGVRPVVSLGAPGDWHQSDLFVIPDRHNFDAGFPSKLPDGEQPRQLHRLTL